MEIKLDYWGSESISILGQQVDNLQGNFGLRIRTQIGQIQQSSFERWKRQQPVKQSSTQPHRQEAGFGGFGSIQASQDMIRCPVTEEDRGKLQYIINELRRKRREQMTILERTIRDPEARERIETIKQIVLEIHTYEDAIEVIAFYTPSTESTTVITAAYDHLQEIDPKFPTDARTFGYFSINHPYFNGD